jgi:hypothetical protein
VQHDFLDVDSSMWEMPVRTPGTLTRCVLILAAATHIHPPIALPPIKFDSLLYVLAGYLILLSIGYRAALYFACIGADTTTLCIRMLFNKY